MRDVQLRDFLAVVDSGGIRAAARRSGQSQASISSNLAALERYYGVALFERSATGVRLTEPGQILIQHARLASVELDKAREEITGILEGRSKTVRVAVSPSSEAVLLPRVVERFHAQFPDATLSLVQGSPSQVAAGLREGTIELAAFPAGGGLGEGFTQQRLFSADVVVAARAGHPLAQATSLVALSSAKWIRGAGREGQEAVLPRAFSAAGLQPPRYVVHRESLSSTIYLLLSTDLLAGVSRPSIAPFVAAGMLVELPIRESLPPLVIHLYQREGRSRNKWVDAVASEFRRAARAQRR